ncbi:multidrug efflux pump subunit AcrA (membrane-fusion protein) [Bradyrhizobium sp. F1.13.1]
MKKKIVVSVAVLAAVAASAGLLHLTHFRAMEKAAAAPTPAPPVPIVAGSVTQHDVPIYLTGVGTVIAYNTYIIRAQIQGQITSINFIEGQRVHAGDLLAQIDPRPYQALIDQYAAISNAIGRSSDCATYYRLHKGAAARCRSPSPVAFCEATGIHNPIRRA